MPLADRRSTAIFPVSSPLPTIHYQSTSWFPTNSAAPYIWRWRLPALYRRCVETWTCGQGECWEASLGLSFDLQTSNMQTQRCRPSPLLSLCRVDRCRACALLRPAVICLLGNGRFKQTDYAISAMCEEWRHGDPSCSSAVLIRHQEKAGNLKETREHISPRRISAMICSL